VGDGLDLAAQRLSEAVRQHPLTDSRGPSTLVRKRLRRWIAANVCGTEVVNSTVARSRQADQRSVTLNHVARQAGVSVTTVSHVINGTRHVAPETVERVQRAIADLNYEVNSAARSLKSGRSRIIGVLITDITNPHYGALVRGVEEAATRAGYQIILCNSDENPTTELECLRVLRGKGVDGVLLVPTGVRHPYFDQLAEFGVPLVFIDRVVSGLRADAVLPDNVGGAKAAASHLIQLGHRRIGIIARLTRGGVPSQRLQGYRRALREHAIPEDPDLIRDGNSRREDGFQRTLELLDLPRPPSAIFAAHNLTTIGALAALAFSGKRIPDDVAIVGFGDFEWAAFMRPPLTTVVQPAAEVGRKGVELLLARIERRAARASRRVVLPAHLAVRESCGASPQPRSHDMERLFSGWVERG
jgi:LacI family transcriptional regulator